MKNMHFTLRNFAHSKFNRHDGKFNLFPTTKVRIRKEFGMQKLAYAWSSAKTCLCMVE